MQIIKALAATISLLGAVFISASVQAGTVCTMDVKMCPDGSYVSRVAPNCAFRACPVYKPQPPRYHIPPHYRPPARPPRPPYHKPRPPYRPPMACSKELRVCADGSRVGRNPARQCNFNPCPRPRPYPYRQPR